MPGMRDLVAGDIQYNVDILSGLFSAPGIDFGLSNIDGFSKTGLLPLYLTGPINRSFNYADAADDATDGSQMYWFASKLNFLSTALYQKKLVRSPVALDILWYPVDRKLPGPDSPAHCAFYREKNLSHNKRSIWIWHRRILICIFRSHRGKPFSIIKSSQCVLILLIARTSLCRPWTGRV